MLRYNEYGDHYSYEDMETKTTCPNGWRAPTGTEANTLIENHSELTRYKKMKGYWFSGSTPYSENTSAIFLPLAGDMHYDESGQLITRLNHATYWVNINDVKWDVEYSLILTFTEQDAPSVYRIGDLHSVFHSLRCVKE